MESPESSGDARAYWSRVAPEKEFKHPLDLELLSRHLTRDFVEVSVREMDVVTMNGNTARAFQLLARSP